MPEIVLSFRKALQDAGFAGDIETSYGINDAARIHNNLFKFSKKGNLAIISDYNSIGKTPITVEDYREMRIPNDAENDQSNTETFELPSFLAPSSFIKFKKNKFKNKMINNCCKSSSVNRPSSSVILAA